MLLDSYRYSQNVGSLAGLPVIRFEETESFARSHDCKLVVLASQTLNSVANQKFC